MKNISFYVLGYIKIKISGDNKSKFLNLAVKNGFVFFDFRKNQDFYTAKLKIKDYKELTQLKREYKFFKTVKLKVIKKTGVPILANKAKKRCGFTVGACVGLFLFVFLSSHYWIINTPEQGLYTNEHILKAANEVGVFEGMGKNSKNMRLAAYEMMLLLPELSFLSLNTNGCTIDVALKYKQVAADSLETQGVGNVVASKAGIIRSVEAKAGMVEVMIGEAVTEGDLLITGIWDTNRGYNEWEKKEEVDIFYEKAVGKVMAETTVNFEVSISDTETDYIKGDEYKRHVFGFFGLNIPITLNLVPSGDYNYEYEKNNLWLLGTKLPIFVEEQRLIRLNEYERIISEEEAKLRLEKLLELEIEQLLGDDGKVLQRSEIIYEYSDNMYTAKLQCICLENIAKTTEVLLK